MSHYDDSDGFFVDENGEVIEITSGKATTPHDSSATDSVALPDFSTTLTDYVDGEEMTAEQARQVTTAIQATGVATYVLITKAHEGKAYKALGYDSFDAYVQAEFNIKRNRAYQLINFSHARDALEEATPEGTNILLTELQARTIKKELPRITEKVREETDGKSAEEAEAIAQEIVKEEQGRILKEKEEEKQRKDEEEAKSQESGNSDNFDGSFSSYSDGEPYHGGDGVPQTHNGQSSSDGDGFDFDAPTEKEEKEEPEGWGQDQPRPPLMKEDDIVFFLDFVERVEKFPTVHNFINSLTPSQRKIISRKALAATDYLNELMDELAIQEMSQ